MAEYYGVTRSEEYLAHYGVKGMKWGVQKARLHGNEKRLDRHFKKASKKLAKLSERADIEAQSKKAVALNKAAKVYGAVGMAGLGTLAGLQGTKQVSRLLAEAALKKKAWNSEAAKNAFDNDAWEAKKIYNRLSEAAGDRADSRWDIYSKADRALEAYHAPIAIATSGALSGAAASKVMTYAAKKRTTPESHAKAVAKRDAWKKEMGVAFKGTKYDQTFTTPRKRKRG